MSVPTSNAPKSLSHLFDKVVVIPGGTSGIGLGVAQACLEHGAKVIVSSSNQDKVTAAVARLKNIDGVPIPNISGFAVDANDIAMLEKFYDDVVKEFGKIDHLVWTAGDYAMLFGTKIMEADRDTLQKALNVRYWAPVLSARYLYKNGLIASEGTVTLTGGTNSKRPAKGWGLIAGGGGAIEAVVRGLAVDFAPLRVNAISPGAIDTELFSVVPEAAKKAYAEQTLVKRLGTPAEIAEAYLFVMKCTFCTGQTLQVDGGRLLA